MCTLARSAHEVTCVQSSSYLTVQSLLNKSSTVKETIDSVFGKMHITSGTSILDPLTHKKLFYLPITKLPRDYLSHEILKL